MSEDTIEKLKMHTPDFADANVQKLAELFPNCVTEEKDKNGRLKRSIDFDLLRQELSGDLVEGPQERYRLDWPGKREALALANAPIAKTLRPYREESVDFDTTKNLYIEGDNLDVLKLLQENYLGKVKMIFIDPPYNTGNDFIYSDDFSVESNEYLLESHQTNEAGSRLVANTESNGRFHSDWASMILPRLKIARNLLREDGVVFITISDHEAHNLRSIGNEVFGQSNFVANLVWQKVFAPKNTAKWFSEDHDHILVFARSKQEWLPNFLPQTEEMIARYKNPDNDPRGPWQSSDLAARNRYDAGLYSVQCPSGREIPGPPKGSYWRNSEEKFHELNRDNRIWWGNDGDNMPRLKRFLSEVKEGKTPQTLWLWKEVGHTQDAKKELIKYVPFENTENVLNSVKPVALIQRMLQIATDPKNGDIVLDFFGGSASTAHAVLKQNRADGGNRKFISVQIAEPLPIPEPKLKSIFDLGLARLKSFHSEIAGEFKSVDTGFRVLKVDSSNMSDVYYQPDKVFQEDLFAQIENIKSDRTHEDLLFQVLLDWGVELSLPITTETIKKQSVLFVDGNALAACFETRISEDLVKEIAKRKPLRAVFRDTGFADDSTKINVVQIFKQLSPETEVRSI